LPEKLRPGGWALEICSLLGATDYVNPASGQDLFDLAEFSRREISLHSAQVKEFVYVVAPYQFEPNLSILDVLMWNPPVVVAAAVRNSVEITEITALGLSR